MKLGISTYAFTWSIGVPSSPPASPMDYFSLVEKAAELNMGLIQFADNLPLHALDKQDLQQLCKEAGSQSIELEAGARGMTEENLEKYMEIAELINSPVLRFVVDGPGFEPGLDRVTGILGNVAETIEKKQLLLALENYERFTAREFRKLVDATGSDHVGICLDCVNSLGAGESLETVVDYLGPVTLNLHIKEFTIRRMTHKMGFLIEGCPAGEGRLNVPWLLSKISNRCISAILEQWVPPEEHVEDTIRKEEQWVHKSIGFLRPLFGQDQIAQNKDHHKTDRP